jgi:uncharacterized protein YdeI (YjbR/CyaY-like superfamily)
MSKPSANPAVDAYLDNAQPFAIPILLHLRALIHQAIPQAEETIKWSRPFFTLNGTIVCNLSAFKQHCSFGFWGEEIAAVLRDAEALKPGAMGSLGRITSLIDLPPDKQLLAWLQQAANFIEAGTHTSPIAARHGVAKAPSPAPETPEDFFLALRENEQAATTYAALSPGWKREYLDWITSAKRPETRARRIATAVPWIAEGKQRNWKYQAR